MGDEGRRRFVCPKCGTVFGEPPLRILPFTKDQHDEIVRAHGEDYQVCPSCNNTFDPGTRQDEARGSAPLAGRPDRGGPGTSPGTVDFGRSFTFVTEDPDWIKKVLIGGAFALLSTLLVGVPFVLGYFARTLRNVVAGAARPLPEWDDLGGIFREGLRLAAVYLVYVIGGAIVAAVPGCLLMAPAMLASGSRHGEAAGAALAGLGMLAFYGLTMLLSLVMLVYLPAALTRAALRGTVADGFDWRAVVAFIRTNLGNYLLSLVIFLVASFLSQFGLLLCCVGVFPAAFWAYLVLAGALGQTVRLSPGSLA